MSAAPGPWGGVPPVQTGSMLQPHRGAVILTLGILGLIVCFICGIFAWVMGNRDLRLMNAGQMDPSGRGTTQAGQILGIVSTILGGIGLVIGLIWIVFVLIIGIGAAASAARSSQGSSSSSTTTTSPSR